MPQNLQLPDFLEEALGSYLQETDLPWTENYIQNPRSGFANPGALDLGQQTATNLTNPFLLVQFLAPMPFAFLADIRLGRFKTLMISLLWVV